MYKLNKNKYASEQDVAEAINEYLTFFIEKMEKMYNKFKDIYDNASDMFMEVIDIKFINNMLNALKAKVQQKIAKEEMKQKRILSSDTIDLLVKDVEKSIKLYPKLEKSYSKAIKKYKNMTINNNITYESLKISVEGMGRSLEMFKKQREFNEKFRALEDEKQEENMDYEDIIDQTIDKCLELLKKGNVKEAQKLLEMLKDMNQSYQLIKLTLKDED